MTATTNLLPTCANLFFHNMVSIIHGLCCPGTPEHHIVEIGLNLLAHSKLTSAFWTHAFATTAYIINRLPTPLLKFQTPYTLAYRQEPSHSRLRIFGSVCYQCLSPLGRTKLDFKSTACIFVGYSFRHKGYMRNYLFNGKTIISRNVIFDETRFPSSLFTPGHPINSKERH